MSFFQLQDGTFVAPLKSAEGTAVASFFVPGDPIASPRPRLGRGGVYHDDRADSWKATIVSELTLYRRAHGLSLYLTCPVELDLQFLFARPKKDAHRYWQDHKPDLDNLEKAVMDALTAGQAWKDDSQVVKIQSIKRYTLSGVEKPGVYIEIVRLPQTAALGNLPPAGNRGARSLSGKETL